LYKTLGAQNIKPDREPPLIEIKPVLKAKLADFDGMLLKS
jgi:hypothetical protein